MRSTWLALALLAAGCFSESPSSGGCLDGEAACDCKTDGTCNEGLDCVASIDKCVPTGCTPGSESCTCVDGDCLADFVCDGGVCIPPSAATTGGDASMSGTTSTDTVVDTTLGSTTTPVTMTEPSTTDPSDPTNPPDGTGTTDETESMSGSASSDPTDVTLGSESSDSDTSSPECPECIHSAGLGDCSAEYNLCQSDPGCANISGCIAQKNDGNTCCNLAQNELSTDTWNALANCAQGFDCQGVCERTCLSDGL